MRLMLGRYLALVLAAGWAVAALGNNLRVTNTAVVVYQPAAGLALIRFDIAWENSWRYTNINHDAAWVFFKARQEGATDWKRVKLAGTGTTGTNTAGYSAGTGTGIELIVPEDGIGVFVRRAAEGSGAVSVTNARVVWNFTTNGLTPSSKAQIQTLALEMVYVAEGSFAAGSGGSGSGEFTLTTINTSNATVAPSGTGSLGGQAGGYPTGQTAPANASWPNGYAAFYCTKYEITQGQYCDFLNTLTRVQQTTRTASQAADYFAMSGGATIGGRNGIRCPSTIPTAPETIIFGCDGNSNKTFNETNDAMDRVCFYMSLADGMAFVDWSGLRPMTELEFEKACRGPLTPVANEFAWGTTNIVTQTGHGGTDGSGTETASPANANCNNGSLGSVRVGIYATASSSRQAAGASYWGIMELSGNLEERPVTIGNSAGRGFQGIMGDGTLNPSGDGDVSDWPGTTFGGAGYRDVHWYSITDNQRVSDRGYATLIRNTDRNSGGRGVRLAPSGVGP